MWAIKLVFSNNAISWLIALVIIAPLSGCDMVGYNSFFEQPSYFVFKRLAKNVEIREYSERTYAESRVDGTGMPARRNAFRLLLNYISGANDRAKKISMTVPVSAAEVEPRPAKNHFIESWVERDSYTMRFFLPKAYNVNSAPISKNQQIHIGYIPSRLEAVLRYSGSQSDTQAKIHEKRLINILNSSGWEAIGTPVALYYNPPFSIPMLRRNEITVPVESR